MTLGGRRFLLSLAILAAGICLALGVSLPIVKLTRFIFWSAEYSLLTTVGALIGGGQLFLGLTVFTFAIVFPVFRLLYLLLISTLPVTEIQRQHRRLKAIEWLGRWSMHDVLVLALTIFFIKSQGLTDAMSLTGVYFFTAAVVLMILPYAWLRTDIELAVAVPPPAIASGASSARSIVLGFCIILAAVFFALGIILPVVRFTTIYVWTNEHSIATIIYALYSSQEYLLCALLLAFSIVFPFLKLFHLVTLVASPGLPAHLRPKSISTMEWLGRYSMTDIMVLALLISYVNASGYTEASVEPGVYFFAVSVLITMLAYGWAHTVQADVELR